MHPNSLRRVALCAALALAAPAIWALPAHYKLTDLGRDSTVESISPAGKIAGVDGRHGRSEAAVWVHGKAHDRANPFSRAAAHGVNDAGVAVGEVGLTFSHAVVWRGDRMTDFDAKLGARLSSATAINAAGDCVIDAETRTELNSYVVPGCVDTGTLVKIASLGGTGTTTAAMNDSGDVAGAADVANGPVHAFLYSQGVTHDLGLLDGDTESAASGVNDLGHVVGTSALYPILFRGFFHDGQAMHALGTFGGAHTRANGINHDDLVVGTADSDSEGQFFHAFVVDAAHDPGTLHALDKMLDKSGRGWKLENAVGINDAGQIIVRGIAPGDTTPRSALLTPAD
jgi:probable HAF family extracellular repeat protein